jgi:hypothetical protein
MLREGIAAVLTGEPDMILVATGAKPSNSFALTHLTSP